MPVPDLMIVAALAAGSAMLAVRLDRRAALLFLAAALAALILASHAVWSLRWQAAGLLLVSLLAAGIGITFVRGQWRHVRLVAGLVSILSLAAALPYYFFPIFDLPDPGGQYRIGVRSLDLRDPSRTGVMFTAGNLPRDLPITIWYPAAASAEGRNRAYFTRREALDEGRSASILWGFPSYHFTSFHNARTHGIESAPISKGPRFPVVIFSHGYWSYRAQNTALMEQLSSRGYIVISVAHPRDGANVRLGNGTVIPTALHLGPTGTGVPATDAALEQATKAFMGGRSHQDRIAALPAYQGIVAHHRLGQSLQIWRDDVLFVARHLRFNPPRQVAAIFARADFERIIYAGMSFGGSTAPSACDADPNCVAAVDLDGENFDPAQFDRDVRAPLLLMLTDQPFSEHQRQEGGFNPTDYAWERFECSGASGRVLRLRARGIRHMGMTDLVLSARDPFKSNFTQLEGVRALALVNATVIAFLEHHVRGAPPQRLSATLKHYPELERLNPRTLREHAARERGACNRQEGRPSAS